MQPEAVQGEPRWVVYGLRDPRDGLVRYVGCTKNLRSRIAGHRFCPATVAMRVWWLELRAAGTEPEVVHLAEFTSKPEARDAEKGWIKNLGHQLHNQVGVRPPFRRHGKYRHEDLPLYERLLELAPNDLRARRYSDARGQLAQEHARRTSCVWEDFTARRDRALAALSAAAERLPWALTQRAAVYAGDGFNMTVAPSAQGVACVERIEQLVNDLQTLIKPRRAPGDN